MDRKVLINLHQTVEFQMLLTELKAMRPVVPRFDPKQDNVEMWKYKSAQSEEYDVLMSIINPFKEPQA